MQHERPCILCEKELDVREDFIVINRVGGAPRGELGNKLYNSVYMCNNCFEDQAPQIILLESKMHKIMPHKSVRERWEVQQRKDK